MRSNQPPGQNGPLSASPVSKFWLEFLHRPGLLESSCWAQSKPNDGFPHNNLKIVFWAMIHTPTNHAPSFSHTSHPWITLFGFPTQESHENETCVFVGDNWCRERTQVYKGSDDCGTCNFFYFLLENSNFSYYETWSLEITWKQKTRCLYNFLTFSNLGFFS